MLRRRVLFPRVSGTVGRRRKRSAYSKNDEGSFDTRRPTRPGAAFPANDRRLYCRAEFTAPWALELPAFDDCLMFHVVTVGRCRLDQDGCEDHELQPGQFALVPHGAGHRLTSEPGVPAANLFDLPREQVSDRYEILRHGGGGAPATITGGAVRFDHPAAYRLVTLLPKVISVNAWNSPELESIQSTLRLMAVEAQELRPGGESDRDSPRRHPRYSSDPIVDFEVSGCANRMVWRASGQADWSRPRARASRPCEPVDGRIPRRSRDVPFRIRRSIHVGSSASRLCIMSRARE